VERRLVGLQRELGRGRRRWRADRLVDHLDGERHARTSQAVGRAAHQAQLVLHRALHDERPAPLRPLDVAGHLQLLHRDPHRREADAHGLGDLPLGRKPVAGSVGAVVDVLEERAKDLVLKGHPRSARHLELGQV
jgi:hypothetical protein